ncbi:MAG: pyridoxamine 5'-phosphate oxidase family protein [Firmicutes bacterium]|nr:pyridoxamine 5'-phosphate oxidase family protein [Bacillota bacterium]
MQEKVQLRRQDRALSLEDSWQLLMEAAVGRLGLATPEGHPYIIPLNYVILNKEIFFHCATEGRKLDIIGQNPQVCFEVDTLLGIKTGPKACDFGAYYKSVIAFGQAYAVEDETRKADILNALTAKYAPPGHIFEPVAASHVNNVTIIGIKVSTLTGKARIKNA